MPASLPMLCSIVFDSGPIYTMQKIAHLWTDGLDPNSSINWPFITVLSIRIIIALVIVEVLPLRAACHSFLTRSLLATPPSGYKADGACGVR